ncbi:glycerol-3-phosphate dehydrogenase/oxidase [soil metagenome]
MTSPAPPPASTELDTLILGGGIAGLWTLALLRARGVDAHLIDIAPLGTGQTLWSQGIIHGGIKYALGGAASAASRAIAEMPERWAAALRGEGEVALAGVDVLSARQLLWTTPGLISRVAGAAASQAIRTAVDRVRRAELPALFAAAPRGVDVYSAGEPVLDPRSVLEALRGPHAERARRAVAIESISAGAANAPVVVSVRSDAGAVVALSARRVLCMAGAGNERLAALAGIDAPMQRRPLHMVIARIPGGVLRPVAARDSAGPAPRDAMLFGHCLGASTVPRITITSQRDDRGDVVWLIGGALAETGVARGAPAQITSARAELAACLPWLDLSALELTAGRIDRAEGLTPGGTRPDVPLLHSAPGAPIAFAWPTKLAFAPLLAEMAAEFIGAPATKSMSASPPKKPSPGVLRSLPAAQVARRPWESSPSS